MMCSFLMQIRCRSVAKISREGAIFYFVKYSSYFVHQSPFCQSSSCLNPRQIINFLLNSSIISVALYFTPMCSLFFENTDKSCILDTQQFVSCILGPFAIQTSESLYSLNNQTFKQVNHRNANFIFLTCHCVYYTMHF